MSYAVKLAEFVKLGAELISEDPVKRYGPHVAGSLRPLEPGFIPLDAEPLLTLVSFYPNASTLEIPGYDELTRRFIKWGETAAQEDYERAYEDWVEHLPLWPYYKRWIQQIVTELNISLRTIAWLPLVKLPRHLDSPPDSDMIRTDRGVLRVQLESLRPPVIWVQSKEVDENAGGLIREITSRFVVQKQSKVQRSSTSAETPEIIKTLRKFLD